MPKIIPVSDLRNYAEVLSACRAGSPVYLTRNGRGRYVVMDIDEYEKQREALALLAALNEGEQSARDGGWRSTAEAFEGLDE